MERKLEKLVTECYRRGSCDGSRPEIRRYKNLLNKDIEEPIYNASKYWGWNKRERNDNISFLTRKLDKWVGKEWDLFWSKIKKELKGNSALSLHVLGHIVNHRNPLAGFVVLEKDLLVIEGVPCYKIGKKFTLENGRRVSHFYKLEWFYVEGGIVKRAPKKKGKYFIEFEEK